MSEWFITDNDCLQCCRPEPNNFSDKEYFEFVQINSYPGHVDGKPFYQVSHSTIFPGEYTEAEVLDALTCYGYSDMDDFVLQNHPDGEFVYNEDGSLNRMLSPDYKIQWQLIAEMFFEMENQEYVEHEFDNWNDAVSCICSIVDLDLYEYYEETKKEFLLALDTRSGQIVVTTPEEFKSESNPDLFLCVRVPDCNREYAAHYFNRGLEALSSRMVINGYLISDGARAILPSMLDPIIEADIGLDHHAIPMIATNWGFDHMIYVSDLDKVLRTLGLLEVNRHRSSVTQGEVVISCDGKEIARYGDDIKLQSQSKDLLFSDAYTKGPLYGPVISGWGSVYPDDHFSRLALVQFGKAFTQALTPKKALTKIIESAKEKQTRTSSKTKLGLSR